MIPTKITGYAVVVTCTYICTCTCWRLRYCSCIKTVNRILLRIGIFAHLILFIFHFSRKASSASLQRGDSSIVLGQSMSWEVGYIHVHMCGIWMCTCTCMFQFVHAI